MQVPLHGFVHRLNKLIPNRPATPFGTPPTRESLMQRIAWCEEHLTGNAKTQFHSACEAYNTRTVKLTPVFFSCGSDSHARRPFVQASAVDLEYALDELMPQHKKARLAVPVAQ